MFYNAIAYFLMSKQAFGISKYNVNEIVQFYEISCQNILTDCHIMARIACLFSNSGIVPFNNTQYFNK